MASYSLKHSREELQESGRQSFCYFTSSKRAFTTPRLEHQFRISWPWPDRASSRRRSSGGSGVDSKAEAAEQAGGGGDTPASADRRQYLFPTRILSLSSDPHPPDAAPPRAGATSDPVVAPRRVAMLLSAGHRFCFPLLPAGPGSPLRWRSADPPPPAPRSPQGPSPTPPYVSELVIGELGAIEWLASNRHTARTQLARSSPFQLASRSGVSPLPRGINAQALRSDAHSDAKSGAEADRVVPFWKRTSPPPSHLPVHAHFMQSVPYKVLWLTCAPGRLIVSLPCEERLVTLHVPPAATPAGTAPGHTVGQTEPIALHAEHTFQLPRGVVPLDLQELLHRPFVAVGTYQSGVVVCWLDPLTGALGPIAHTIPLTSIGSALFPVTHMVALFPARGLAPPLNWPARLPRSDSDGSDEDGLQPDSCPAATRSRAASLASLQDGALICSSPFHYSPVVLKGIGAASTTVAENLPASWAQDPLISMGIQADYDVGMLAISANRGIDRYTLPEGGMNRDVRGLRKRQLSPVSSGKTGQQQQGAAQDPGRFFAHAPASHNLLASERVPPLVVRYNCLGPSLKPLTMGATPPIYQLKMSKFSLREGYFVQHFLPAATLENDAVLLERVQTGYRIAAKTPLQPMPTPAPETATAAVNEKAGATATPGTAATPNAEDLCAGLVFITAGNQWMTVAAAHHGDTISILQYTGREDELGMFKRVYKYQSDSD